MKTRKAALTAIAAAGLAALPLSAAADSTAVPQGTAWGAAAQVTLSLAPLKASAAGPTIDTVLQTLNTLYGTLCGNAAVSSQPVCGLTIPTSLPDSVQVSVAQSYAKGSLLNDFSDVLSGNSNSSPLATTWPELNFDISVVENAISSYIGTLNTLLSNALTSIPTIPGVTLPTSGVITVNTLNVEGAVSAFLNQAGQTNRYAQSASAVSLTGAPKQVLAGTDISIDPYSAVAANSKALSDPSIPASVTSPQVSAENSLIHVGLPALTTSGTSSTDLANLITSIKSVTTTLLNAIASYQQGGVNALTGALQGTPLSPLVPVIQSLPTSTTNSLDLTPFTSLATQLSATADELSSLQAALTGLPDVTNLIYSTNSLSTAKFSPVASGGVDALATSTLGSVAVLPIGSQLASVVKTALSTVSSLAPNVPVNTNIDGSTPLISVGGVTSSSEASILKDGSGVATGTGGLQAITVLGQNLPVAVINQLLNQGKGTEAQLVVTIPTLGSVTVDITQGVPNVVSNTSTNRYVRMATLDIRLINGVVCTANCVQIPGSLTGTAAGAHTATATGGIAALGPDGSVPFDLSAGDTLAGVSVGTPTTPPGCTSNCSPLGNPPLHQTLPTTTSANLPSTGMFGGGVLPAGLLLIAVAISLRLVPSLRTRLHRVR